MVVFLLALVTLTSAGAYVYGRKGLRLPSQRLGPAVGKMLESLGAALCFLIVNLGLGLILVLAARTVTGDFVSVYLLDDVSLLGLSLLQALTFRWWKELSRVRDTAHPARE